MTDNLTTPIAPDNLDPRPLGPLNGDIKDDDGQAIDDFFEAAYQGPEVESESAPYRVEDLPVTTRMLSRRVTVGTVDGVLYDPIQVFPPDPNRKQVILISSDDVSIASDKTDVYGAGIANVFPWSTTEHTGAIWVYSTESNAVNVSVWVVTS